jgi:hypothetical protein
MDMFWEIVTTRNTKSHTTNSTADGMAAVTLYENVAVREYRETKVTKHKP